MFLFTCVLLLRSALHCITLHCLSDELSSAVNMFLKHLSSTAKPSSPKTAQFGAYPDEKSERPHCFALSWTVAKKTKFTEPHDSHKGSLEALLLIPK